MKKLSILFIIVCIASGCATEEVKTYSTTVGLFTPYVMFPETLQGQVKSIIEKNYFAKEEEGKLRLALQQTAEKFSMNRSAEQSLALYTTLCGEQPCPKETEDSLWDSALRVIEEEWKIWENIANSAEAAFTDDTGDA